MKIYSIIFYGIKAKKYLIENSLIAWMTNGALDAAHRKQEQHDQTVLCIVPIAAYRSSNVFQRHCAGTGMLTVLHFTPRGQRENCEPRFYEFH